MASISGDITAAEGNNNGQDNEQATILSLSFLSFALTSLIMFETQPAVLFFPNTSKGADLSEATGDVEKFN